MCNLTTKLKINRTTGYKAVLVDKDGNFWSSAMGFRYETGEPVPVVEEQIQLTKCWRSFIPAKSPTFLLRLTRYWFSFILDEPPHLLFKDEMVGRTSVFKDKENAYALAETFEHSGVTVDDRQLTPAVVKTVISKDLMIGTYLHHNFEHVSVVAGRVIESMEQIQ